MGGPSCATDITDKKIIDMAHRRAEFYKNPLKYEWNAVSNVISNGFNNIKNFIENIKNGIVNVWDWIKKYLPIILLFLGFGVFLWITGDT